MAARRARPKAPRFRTRLIITGAAVATAGIVVGAVLIARSGSGDSQGTGAPPPAAASGILTSGTAAVPSSAGAGSASITAPPTVASSASGAVVSTAGPAKVTTTSPTKIVDKPSAAQGFSGNYQVTYRITAGRELGAQQVGTVTRARWKVSTRCAGDRCTSAVSVNGGAPVDLNLKGGTTHYSVIDPKEPCLDDAGKPTGAVVRAKIDNTFTVKATGSGPIATVSGVTIYTQLDRCPKQQRGMFQTRTTITATRVGS